MDEKKIREAIELMKNQITIIKEIPEFLGLKEKTDEQIEETMRDMVMEQVDWSWEKVE